MKNLCHKLIIQQGKNIISNQKIMIKIGGLSVDKTMTGISTVLDHSLLCHFFAFNLKVPISISSHYFLTFNNLVPLLFFNVLGELMCKKCNCLLEEILIYVVLIKLIPCPRFAQFTCRGSQLNFEYELLSIYTTAWTPETLRNNL